MNRLRPVRLGLWLLFVAAALVVIARGTYTADLSAFLPVAPTSAQRLLVAQLKEGAASRIVLAAVSGGDPSSRARVSSAMAAQLRGDRRFRTVQNGDVVDNPADQAYVFEHRYLLSDRFARSLASPDELRERLAESVDLLGSSLGIMAKDLFQRDPTGETIAVVSSYERASAPAMADGVWTSRDGQLALLVLETTASGSDTDAQQAALGEIKRSFEAASAKVTAAPPVALRLTGPPVFSVDARATIEREAVHLSAVSSALIVVFLLFVYRSVRAFALGMLPVVTGALAGVATVALGFGIVHGVTLGFGVTLIGEAVDYSVYMFLQGSAVGANPQRWAREFWPTVRLGVLTSVVGFASLLPSSFPGLAQLGCYTIAGLFAAALTTRYVLPELAPRQLSFAGIDALGRGFIAAASRLRPLRRALWAIPATAVLAFACRGGALWNQELSALWPIPAEARAFDARIRADIGAAEAGTLVVVDASSAELALQGAEAAGEVLSRFVAAGRLAGFESPARYLPSVSMQRKRQAALPEPAVLHAAFLSAVADLPLRPEQFAGFFEDVESARHAGSLTLADVDATSMGAGVRALMVEDRGRYTALMPLQAVRTNGDPAGVDIAGIASALGQVKVPGAAISLLDIKHESDDLYSSYLHESVRLALVGLAAIVLLLVASLRSVGRVARVVAPLVLSVLAVMSVFAIVGHPMTLLHLVGLLLTVAIGSNYTLLLDRERARGGAIEPRTVASLVVANLTAVIGFGVLATSSVPVLSDVGSTVAPGTLLGLVFGAVMAGPWQEEPA